MGILEVIFSVHRKATFSDSGYLTVINLTFLHKRYKTKQFHTAMLVVTKEHIVQSRSFTAQVLK